MPTQIVSSFRLCIFICTLGLLAACESDPTPIVNEPESSTLSLAPTDGRGGTGLVASTRDYRLGANDRTRITVFGQPNLTGEFTLDGNGVIAFPLIGNVNASTPAVESVITGTAVLAVGAVIWVLRHAPGRR